MVQVHLATVEHQEHTDSLEVPHLVVEAVEAVEQDQLEQTEGWTLGSNNSVATVDRGSVRLCLVRA
jgi:hypothetical protein